MKSLVEHVNNREITRNLTNRFPFPYREEDGAAFIKSVVDDHSNHILAIAVGGEAVGGIGLHPQTDIYKINAELGYWLSQQYWGNGIMTRAAQEMVAAGFRTYDIHRIFARPFGSNIASQRVLEKAGFILEARFEKTILKQGRFEDELIYAIRKPIAKQ